ncbi:hypothetical protein P8452_21749 [Trifolium repens]|jgi:hypothetical protein|nr:hypothetical protein P8452_21749 [Trifolium repens]
MAQQLTYGIIFRQGKPGEKQHKLYEALTSREGQPTRYADVACLRRLGLYDSVNHMLNLLNLNYFLSQINPVYAQLTLEFLSSLKVTIIPETRSSSGTVNFCMFNEEHEFNFNEPADLLHFPHGNNVACEVTDNE